MPTSKLVEEVRNDPFTPTVWGRAQPGMLANEEVDDIAKGQAWAEWRAARNDAIQSALELHDIGIAKGIANRLLEPFMWVDVVITSTKWANFFTQRLDEAAEPHMRIVAEGLRDAIAGAEFAELRRDQWHLPYVTEQERHEYPIADLRMISAARCARVSYAPHDGTKGSVEADLNRAQHLLSARPMHAVPFEHQATPDALLWDDIAQTEFWTNANLHGNFHGWVQHRQMLAGNAVEEEI